MVPLLSHFLSICTLIEHNNLLANEHVRNVTVIIKIYYHSTGTSICFDYASSNVKPEGGGGGTPGICGAFDLYCLPHPQEFD